MLCALAHWRVLVLLYSLPTEHSGSPPQSVPVSRVRVVTLLASVSRSQLARV